jgi:phage terminase large subunit
MTEVDARVPRAFKPLLAPKRYKEAYGGRGGAKSHFFAEQLVLRCFASETRAACVREIQNTLKESVRQLIVDKIRKLGLSDHFTILDAEIRGRNGSLIIFKGMQSYNAESIKSLEGFDIIWVEEAQSLSATSLRVLRPTLRKAGSVYWFSWNPRHDTDPVDQFFRGPNKSPEAISVFVNWPDNRWFPDVLRRDMEHDVATDPEMAEHVWGGGYELVSEGSYFAKLIAAAEREGRIGDFPYNPHHRLVTSWDIGVDDYTAVWFIQDDGLQATVIDYYEASGEGAPQIVEGCLPELLEPVDMSWRRLQTIGRPVPYRYERHLLPHDVKMREWGAGARSRVETLMGLGVKPIHVGVQDKDGDRIAATRKLLPLVRFHNSRRVALGVGRLRRFSRRWNESMQTYGDPLHDINSHGADAFGEYAVNCGIVPLLPPEPKAKPLHERSMEELGFKPLNKLTMDELLDFEDAPKREGRA